MKTILLILSVVLLSACNTMRYSSTIQLSEKNRAVLVKDSVARLITLYPPAKTTFLMHQQVRDAFGLTLVERLRKSGYRLVERAQSKEEANFFYLIDAPIINNLYRVTFFIGKETLTRAYVLRQYVMVPIGSWSRKE